MFYRTLILIVMTALVLWPTTLLNAEVSKSVSFTLSVTIPERAELPSLLSHSPDSLPPELQTFHSSRVQYQPSIRDNEDVLLASYVVD